MAQERRDREAVLRQLRRMLRGKPNDAVKLAFLGEDETEAVDGLDLTLLSEFKRSSSGVAEVKLWDQLKILELLDRLSAPEGGEDAGAERFFQALDQRAEGEEDP